MPTMQSAILEHFGIVNTTIEKTNLVQTIDRCIPTQRKVSVGESVKAMILNGMGFVSEALYLTPMFYESQPISLFFGETFSPNDFNDDTLGRSLDDLYEYGLSTVFSIVAIESMQAFGYASLVAHLDSSSFSFYGEYSQNIIKEGDQEIHITHGYSKDHRPDLKQILVGLICDAKTSIPMFFQALSGNSSDKSSFVPMIEEFQTQLSQSQMPKMIVADSALYSEKNIQSLAQSTLFLTRVPDTLSSAKELYSIQDLSEMTQHSSDPRYRFQWYGSLYGNVEQQWLLVYNETLAKTKSKTVDKRVEKAEKSLRSKLKKLAKKSFACEEDARRSVAEIASKAKYHSIEIIDIEAKKKYKSKGRPAKDTPYTLEYFLQTKVLRDEQKIIEQKQQEGFFILATNRLDEISAEDLLSSYKHQNNTVERGFRFLKNPKFFVDALYLQKPSRIAAMLMVMSLSLLIYSLTEYYLREQLVKKGETLPNQLGKPTNRVTLEWIFKVFRNVQLLMVDAGNGLPIQQMVLNLKPIHEEVLRVLGDDYAKCYFSTS